MASLERATLQLRTALAPHVSLQLVDRGRLRSSNNIERDGLVGVAAQTTDLKIAITRVEGVTEVRRGLSRTFEA
jgi:hypothetical protein